MPVRLLREGILTSERIASLNWRDLLIYGVGGPIVEYNINLQLPTCGLMSIGHSIQD